MNNSKQISPEANRLLRLTQVLDVECHDIEGTF